MATDTVAIKIVVDRERLEKAMQSLDVIATMMREARQRLSTVPEEISDAITCATVGETVTISEDEYRRLKTIEALVSDRERVEVGLEGPWNHGR